MASITNYTIKKYDDTTDILWTAIQPSSGAGSPAIWKSLTVGTADSHRPEYRLTTSPSKDNKSTVARGTAVFPETATDTTTGLTSVVRSARGFVNFDIPRDMSDTAVNEFVYQFINLIRMTRSDIKSRIAPT